MARTSSVRMVGSGCNASPLRWQRDSTGARQSVPVSIKGRHRSLTQPSSQARCVPCFLGSVVCSSGHASRSCRLLVHPVTHHPWIRGTSSASPLPLRGSISCRGASSCRYLHLYQAVAVKGAGTCPESGRPPARASPYWLQAADQALPGSRCQRCRHVHRLRAPIS